MEYPTRAYGNQTLEGTIHPGLAEQKTAREPEIPLRVSRLFNDLHELRETVVYLSNRLDFVMSMDGPKPPLGPEMTSPDPATGLGVQLADMNRMVNDTRQILSNILGRLEV